VSSEERATLEHEGARSSSSRGSRPLWQETLILVVLAVVIAVLIKTLFVQAFYVPSESMEPGLQGGNGVKPDRILVEKPSYWGGGTPARGDIVVFSDPGGWLSSEEDAAPSNPLTAAMAKIGLYPTGGHLVKRVIGVAGDTIHCCSKTGELMVNGHPIDESSYARPADEACGGGVGRCYGPMPGTRTWTAGPVPAGELFVMGDNRARSADSSYHLCTSAETECTNSPWVPVRDVVGKVVALVWPLGRAHLEHRPADFAGIPAP
jgi:signal peptidase I